MKIFLNSPREDFEKLELQKPTGYFNSFIIIPTGELHDSGYGCMKFALFNGEEYVGCVGGYSDVIHFNGIGGYGLKWGSGIGIPKEVPVADFCMDLFPSGLFRVFSSKCYLFVDPIIRSNFSIYAQDRETCAKFKEDEEFFPFCPTCNRITDPGCVQSCDAFKELTGEGGLMFKIIDYAGETFKDGFGSCETAYNYLYISYNTEFIHDMGFRVIREEVEDEQSKI